MDEDDIYINLSGERSTHRTGELAKDPLGGSLFVIYLKVKWFWFKLWLMPYWIRIRDRKKVNMWNVDPRVVERLRSGDWSFGHAGRHQGNGSPDCPRTLHHHHDEFCHLPTKAELITAGIDPKVFKARSRA